jgi:hypothetical protein
VYQSNTPDSVPSVAITLFNQRSPWMRTGDRSDPHRSAAADTDASADAYSGKNSEAAIR